jgi:hypothetical protein
MLCCIIDCYSPAEAIGTGLVEQMKNRRRDEIESYKRMWAHLGVVVCASQFLERHVLTIVVMTEYIAKLKGKRIRGPKWERLARNFETHHSQATLGRLLRRIGIIARIPNKVEQMLAEALRERNWAIHAFFRSRFETEWRRRGTIKRLKECRNRIEAALVAFEKSVKSVRDKYGYMDMAVIDMLDKLWDKKYGG